MCHHCYVHWPLNSTFSGHKHPHRARCNVSPFEVWWCPGCSYVLSQIRILMMHIYICTCEIQSEHNFFRELYFTSWILLHPMFLLTWWHHFMGVTFFYESHCCCLVLSSWCVHWEHFYQVLLLSQCSAARKLLVIESVLHLRWPGRVIIATPTSCRKILCGNRIMGLYQGAWCYFIFPISILWFKKKQWNVLHPSELHDSVLGRTVGLVDHIFNVCDVQDEEKKPFFLPFECESA